MGLARVLGLVLVLGWVSALRGLPVQQKLASSVQENFNIEKCQGEWNEVAVAIEAPFVRQAIMDAGIATMELKGLETDRIHGTLTSRWLGSCREFNIHGSTTTPGQVMLSIPNMQTEAVAYVVRTDYNQYAFVVLHCSPGFTARLFSRTRHVTDAVLDDFKILVRDIGLSNDSIVIPQDKGKCVPGEVMDEEDAQPVLSVQRILRSVSAPDEEDPGSGDSVGDVMDPASCLATPDRGPCFGIQPRYFFNSSSMSCQEFLYGGCMGNGNNFPDERECLQRCRTEAACRLPMVSQACTGQQPTWAFDVQSGKCEAIRAGLCQVNGNKYYSKAECEEYCGVVKDDPEIGPLN